MRSNVVISQTLILFSKKGWIFFPPKNSLVVKQSNVPFELGFMNTSWKHHALKTLITLKTLWGSPKRKCVPKDA
jgi:hypothetical protein